MKKRYFMVVFVLILLVSKAWGNLPSGSLSTEKLFNYNSAYPIQPYSNRSLIGNIPGGLSSTAAWSQYGMRLDWNVTSNGDGTYTYHYYFGPGWYPPTQPTSGSTDDPYVTNKTIFTWDIQISSDITDVTQLSNVSWNAYQYDGKKIGSGTASHWDNYIDPDTGNPTDTVKTSGDATVLKVANLTGKTGHKSVGYTTQNLFHGLQWILPRDEFLLPVWNTDVNFELTFTTNLRPGWGNFFANSDPTKANNDYSEVVAFDGTFDSTGRYISSWSNGVATPGTPETNPPTVTIGNPSVPLTKNGPVVYTVEYNDDNFYSINLSPDSITLIKSDPSLSGTVTVSDTDKNNSIVTGKNIRTVTISGISGNGTLGISIKAGTAVDVAGNLATASGNSTIFEVDNSSPSVSISNPSTDPPSNYTRNGPVIFTVTYNDPHFNMSTLTGENITLNRTGSANGTLSVSGSGSLWTASIDNIIGSGTLGISIAAGTASDTLGHLAPAAGPSTTITVDNTPPPVTITSNPVNPTNATSANFEFSSTKAGSTFQCSIDGGAFAACTSPTVYSGLVPGSHTFAVKATDALGNADSTSYAWVIEPTVAVTYSPAGALGQGPYKSGTAVTISATFMGPINLTNPPMITLSGANSQSATVMSCDTNMHCTYDYTAGAGTGTVDVKITAGTDLAGNAVLAIPVAGAAFTIDNAAPIITSKYPVSESADINTAITVTFDERFDTTAINGASVTVSTLAGAQVNGTLSYDNANTTAVFMPSAGPLDYGTKYKVTVSGVKDLAGNIMASDYTWTFTTSSNPDKTPPVVVSTTPSSGETPVDINSTPTVIFSEKIASLDESNFTLKSADGPVSGSVNYDYANSKNQNPLQAVFTPKNPLSYNTTYTATITGDIRDLAGNAMTSGYSWTFTTAPHYGDLSNTGGSMELQDAVIELQIAAGLVKPTALQLANGDVAPLVNGMPHGDGKIDIVDVVAILMKLVGLSSW